MRERLVLTLVAMTVLMLALFGAIRAYSTADMVNDEERNNVSDSADLVAVAVADRPVASITPSFLQKFAHERQTVTYLAADGTRISTRTVPRDEDDISATRDVQGGSGARIILTQEASVSSGRVSDELSSLVLLGLGLAALAAVIGWLLAARFAYPFHRLAADATRIGEGHFDTPVHHSYMREAAELGNALRSAAGQLDVLVRRERELAVVASHELRTPLTALRLSLEDLTMWPQTHADVADELQRSLGEVDRLSSVVTTLLEGGSSQLDKAEHVDLSVAAADAVERWAPRAKAKKRKIKLTASSPAVVRAARASVDRAVDVLIDNALQHGTGTVTVAIFGDDSYYRFRVIDEGPRFMDPGVLHVSPAGPQAGLTTAATEAEAIGGFLGIAEEPTTLIGLMLPRADRRRRASDRSGERKGDASDRRERAGDASDRAT